MQQDHSNANRMYIYNGPDNLRDLRDLDLAGAVLIFNGSFSSQDLRAIDFQGATVMFNNIRPVSQASVRASQSNKRRELIHVLQEAQDAFQPPSGLTLLPSRDPNQSRSNRSDHYPPRSTDSYRPKPRHVRNPIETIEDMWSSGLRESNDGLKRIPAPPKGHGSSLDVSDARLVHPSRIDKLGMLRKKIASQINEHPKVKTEPEEVSGVSSKRKREAGMEPQTLVSIEGLGQSSLRKRPKVGREGQRVISIDEVGRLSPISSPGGSERADREVDQFLDNLHVQELNRSIETHIIHEEQAAHFVEDDSEVRAEPWESSTVVSQDVAEEIS